MLYNQYLFKNLPFDPEKLAPIINAFHLIQMLVVNSDSGEDGRRAGRDVEEEARHAQLSHGGVPHGVYMETLKKEKGADWVRVPFKGGGEAINAIMGGTTPIGSVRARQRDLEYPRRQDDAAGADEQHPLAELPGGAAAGRVGYKARRREAGTAFSRLPARRGRSSTGSE